MAASHPECRGNEDNGPVGGEAEKNANGPRFRSMEPAKQETETKVSRERYGDVKPDDDEFHHVETE